MTKPIESFLPGVPDSLRTVYKHQGLLILEDASPIKANFHVTGPDLLKW